MKTKDFSLEIKAAGDDGSLEGYASVFSNVDSYGDRVEPGAFVDSLTKHRREGTMPLMLWQHNPDEPIGVWEDFAEDGKGLWAKGRLLKGVQKAEEAHIRLKAGAVRGLSIGYRVKEAAPDKGVLSLKKLDLLEVSIVSFPANQRARVEAVKSERMEEFARRLRDGDPLPVKDFEDILREAGVPRAMAVQIASVGYAKAIRGEPEGKAKNTADDVLADLKAAVSAFSTSS